MRTTAKDPGRALRSSSPWGSQKLFYLAVFAVTAAGVYRWGVATPRPNKPAENYSSTATVRLPGDSHAPADPEEIKRHITSRQNVYQAVRQLGLAAEPPAGEDPQATAARVTEEVSRNLRVTADTTDPAGDLTVSIVYSNTSPHYAAELANTLAESYAEEHRAACQRRADRAWAEARQATDQAEREFLEAKTRLEESCQPESAPRQATQPAETVAPITQQDDISLATSAEDRQPEPEASAAATASDPVLVENPVWAELSQQLAVLKQRRKRLLIDRTPLHPEVQDAELQIAELERELSATPKAIPGEASEKSPTADRRSDADMSAAPAVPAPSPTPPQQPERVQNLRALVPQVGHAAEAYRQAFHQERRAWQDHQRAPRVELELAEPQQPRGPSPSPRPLAALWAALGAALAVSVGMGMISAGTTMQPPLETVEQVRNVLPVPVVGMIPESNPSSHPAATQSRRRIVRAALVVVGLTLIAGCGMLLWRAWGG